MEQAYAQEYLTGNESIAFPFKEDAEGLTQKDGTPVHGVAAILPRNFLLDLVATIPASQQSQVYLKSISRAGSTYTFTFGTATTTLGTWPLAAIPAERSVVAFQSGGSRITLRMVTGPGFASYLAAMGDPSTDEFQLRLPLETAAVEFVPHKLLDLILGSEELTGNILLYEGYNIELQSAPSDPATGVPAKLIITAGSGLGAGKYNPCADHSAPIGYIGRINGQTADKNGNIQLDGDECYRILPNHVSVGRGIGIANDCIPCCTCDDYANQVAALKKIYADFVAAKNALGATVTKVNEDITLWNNVIVPRLFRVTLDIYVTRGNQTGVFLNPDRKIASGRSLNFASVVVVVKNPRNEPLNGVSLAITLPGGLAVEQTVYFKSWQDADHTGSISQQILSGTDTSFAIGTMPKNSYFKPIILVKKAYPSGVTGVFTATISATGIDPVSKSVTV